MIVAFADFVTDWVAAYTFTTSSSNATSTIGMAMVLNLLFNPMLVGTYSIDPVIFAQINWIFPEVAPYWTRLAFHAIFSPVIMLFEELYYAFKLVIACRRHWNTLENGDADEETEVLKEATRSFYNAFDEQRQIRSRVISVESWIQLSFQTTLVTYQYFYPPMGEIVYNHISYDNDAVFSRTMNSV